MSRSGCRGSGGTRCPGTASASTSVARSQISVYMPSTRAPAQAVGEGLRSLAALGHDLGAIEYFVHGATIAINTVLQRSGAHVALLVTRGFRDILEIQRLRLRHPFDFNSTRARPLVPRSSVYEI